MTDIIIIGGGPAGVSAALYTARAGLKTIIIHKCGGALEKAERIDNYYGSSGVSGPALYEAGLAHAAEMGAEIIGGEAVSIKWNKTEWTVSLVGEGQDGPPPPLTARALLLATGASRPTPAIPGLSAYEGKGVSHCAVCDAFFYKGKDVAVLGSGPYAVSEASELMPLVKSLIFLTNGTEPSAPLPPEANVRKEKIREVQGEARLNAIVLEPDGEVMPINGLFIAEGTASATELARKAGAFAEDGAVVVDKNMQTGVPGLWAAGDCTVGMKQIAKAVYEGAAAGMDMVRYIRKAKDDTHASS